MTGPISDAGAAAVGAESWDVLHDHSEPHLHWSTDNLGEAAPGVLSPLGWSLWRDVGERASREALYRLGALTVAERRAPADPAERILRVFHGRVAMQVEFLATLGDRMPGTTGQKVVLGIFGRVPDDIEFRPTRSRYPAIAARMPVVMATVPGAVRALAADTDDWWRRNTREVTGADLPAATRVLADSSDRFFQALALHTTCLMGVVQPMFQALTAVVERAGTGDVALLSGSGGAEMAVVGDIWRAAKDEIPLSEVVANHGFHGPAEGEVSSRVWREDDSALRRLLADYAARPDTDSPWEQERRRRTQATAARDAVLAALPRHERAIASGVLSLAYRRVPLRGVGKRSFLQALDVARASARRIGALLHADGLLTNPDDVVHLTYDELTGPPPSDVADLVEQRRQRRRHYRTLAVPAHWTGNPEPLTNAPDETTETVEGVGVSAGVVEGIVRVVTEPDFAEVEAGEVLVAPTTDPSWSSVMFVSSALVVDIGSVLSHAAVVARELGLPCVVNTRTGTRALRTGDLVRVDGGSGHVQILKRADPDRKDA
jgi:pyruvate,water dikinase